MHSNVSYVLKIKILTVIIFLGPGKINKPMYKICSKTHEILNDRDPSSHTSPAPYPSLTLLPLPPGVYDTRARRISCYCMYIQNVARAMTVDRAAERIRPPPLPPPESARSSFEKKSKRMERRCCMVIEREHNHSSR